VAALDLIALREESLGGLCGTVSSVVFETELQLRRDDGKKVGFTGHFSSVVDIEVLDMSVVGRDITNMFHVIVDWPQQVVCLLRDRHSYRITPADPSPHPHTDPSA